MLSVGSIKIVPKVTTHPLLSYRDYLQKLTVFNPITCLKYQYDLERGQLMSVFYIAALIVAITFWAIVLIWLMIKR